MSQYLKNPILVWDGQTQTYQWTTDDLSSVKNVVSQNALHWQHRWESFYSQANRTAESYHEDAGMRLSTGYIKFRSGYEQSGVDVPGGVRLLLRVEYDVVGSDGVGDVEVKLRVIGDDIVDSGWSPASRSREKLLVLRSIRSGLVNVQVWFQNERHEGTVCDIIVRGAYLERVDDDYGGNLVPTLRPTVEVIPEPETPPPAPVPVPQPEVPAPTTPAPMPAAITVNLNVTLNVPQSLVEALNLAILAWSKAQGLVG